MSNRRIVVYDTTLRDGAQGPAVSFSAADKVRIAETPPASRDKRWRVVEVLERGTRV